MEEESPHELGGIQAHELGLVAVGAVFPSEGHLTLLHGDQTLVGDGDPIAIAPEVVEDLLGPGKGRLAVDDPVLSCRLAESIGGLGPRSCASRRRQGPARACGGACPGRLFARIRTANRKPGFAETHRVPSGWRPPPVTMQWR